ncbi:MAG TPA: spermidine synthase [Candidatus Xenobia bacterium]|jgi:spermidine synthase
MTWYIEKQSPSERHAIGIGSTLYKGRTRYQTVRIVETPSYGRLLILDGDIQSAQFDEATYHEVLVHPAMMLHPKPRRVLIMGGGEGATLREVLRYRSVQRVVMVDLDGELVELCQKWLPTWSQGCFSDQRLDYRADDARAFVDTTRETFDVVIHDLPQPVLEGETRPELVRLFSVECWKSVSRCLAPDGVILLQSCSARIRDDGLYRIIHNTLRQVFPHVLPMHAYIPSFANDWGFLLGSKQVDPASLDATEVDSRMADRWVKGPSTQYYAGDVHATLSVWAPGRLPSLPQRAVLRDGKPLPKVTP